LHVGPHHALKPWLVGVHQGGLRVFRPMMQELLNIEQFCPKKSKSKLNVLGNWGLLLVLLEGLQQIRFKGISFIISRPKLWGLSNF
jgi:hypothetical protein